MDNKTIAGQFSLLSKLMTLHEENPFKIRSYSNAARQIERLPKALSSMNIEDIGKIPGIGTAILKKIETLLDTGSFPQLEKYQENTPEGVQNLLSIKGIGPKKLAVIWKEMGIETPGELLYACHEDRLTRFKGFGAKTQEKIKKAIEYYLQSRGFFLYAEALSYSDELLNNLNDLFDKEVDFLPTGALRRQCNTLDILEYVTTLPIEKMLPHLPNDFQIAEKSTDTLTLEKQAHPKVKFYTSSPNETGSTLFRTTGTEDFIHAFYKKNKGLKEEIFQTEKEIFRHAGCSFIPPALRECPLEDIPSSQSSLIQQTDIKGIIHSHSKWSDGKNSIEEMAKAAQRLGMEYLVISDHSKSAGYANGLSVERVQQQQEEIDQLNEKLSPFKIFKSIESDILSDGSLDYDDEILKSFDLVIASVHSNLYMEKEQATQRLLTAISNPYTTILGHATGRLLLSRKGYPIDHKAIIDACIKNNVVIEINAHPRRLDLDWSYIPYALQKGALLSINPDAHSVEGIKDTVYGVFSAQKGGLTAEKNLSSFPLQEFENCLEKRK